MCIQANMNRLSVKYNSSMPLQVTPMFVCRAFEKVQLRWETWVQIPQVFPFRKAICWSQSY